MYQLQSFLSLLFAWKESLTRFNQSSSKCICMRKKDSRWEYLPPKTKWRLLELLRTWWCKLNKYSLLLIISFPTAKENLSRPATPRHITTRTLRAINMTIKSSKFCSCIVLTNAKILNYKTVNFLVERSPAKVLIFILLLQRFKEKNSVQRTIIRIDLPTAVITFLFQYIMLSFFGGFM